ncbi:MAG: cation diffusion facilitator family transporter [Lachnospiraceae bacterium]
MITLLSNIFIKNKDQYQNPNTRSAYGKLCGGFGIFLNICLFIGKLIAGLLSNSIAIIADAANNLSDAASSAITLIGFKISEQKPDKDHPYGHGRVEYIAGLLISVAIVFMGFELIKSSFDKIIHPQKMACDMITVIILIASILVKIYMFSYNRSIGKKIESVVMSATATDSLSDTVATFVVLLSTLIYQFTGFNIDAYCGVLVGFFILYSGTNAAKETISPLLGQPPKPEFVEQIKDLVMSHEEILGIHDMIVHDYGPGRIMTSLHAEVDAKGDIMEIHDLIDRIENEIQEQCSCQAVIHMDPILVNDPYTDELKEKVRKMIDELDPNIHFHDFRVVKGPTHTNIIFDIVLPFDYRYKDEYVLDFIRNKLSALEGNFNGVISIDKGDL